MMGFGSYGGNNYGGGGGGGSSSLSALAPPFTVDRSIPKPGGATPLVDLGEPLNWVDSNPYKTSFNSTQSSQLPQQLDLDPIPAPPSSFNQSSDLFEGIAYYPPPYVSPTLHPQTFNDQTAQWGGGLWDWEKGKPGQRGGSFYSKETTVSPSSIYTDHINLGAHPSKSLKTCEEASHNIYSLGREKHVGSASIEKPDYNPVVGQNSSFVPVDYLKPSVIGSSSTFTETNLQAPPLDLVSCKSNPVTFSTPYEKPLGQHTTTTSDTIPAMKSSPGIVIRPPAVGTGSSSSNTFKNVNNSIGATDINFTSNNPSIVKEPHYLLNFGSKNEFDPSQLNFNLDGNWYLSGESLSTNTEKLSTTNMASTDCSGHLFRAKSGINFSHIGPDNFGLALHNNEAVIAVENSLETLDHYNPPVDSPCWKGAPASHNAPFGASEPGPVQLGKKFEGSDSSNGQARKFIPMNTANMVKLPPGKPGEVLMSNGNGALKDNSVSPLRLPAAVIPSCIEHQPDNAGKAGSYQKRPTFSCELKFSDDASERKKDYVLFDKPVDEVEKAFHISQQSLAESGLASKNMHTSETGVADLKMKINDVSGCGSSNVPGHAVRMSCSPSSVENISTKNTNFFGKKPFSRSSIGVLVDTIHNLSELLLYHCSNEAFELKEQDLKSLEKVISNLDTCMSKNIGQESLFSEPHKETSMGRPQVSTIDVVSKHVQEKRKHSGKKHETCSDFIPVKSGTDIKVKNDKVTQAIKKVLIENFHEEETHPQVLLYKNLWLEAEAALCSINYMARFNNMKSEIEKCKLDSEKGLSEDKPDVDRISGSKCSAELNTNKKLTAVADVGVTTGLSEDTPDVDKVSSSKCSAELNTDKKLTAVADVGATTGVSNQNSSNTNFTYDTDEFMARFHVLKHRLNSSNSVHTRDVSDLSSSKVSLDLNEADKLATKEKDSSGLGLQTQDSPVAGTACNTDDVDASVMARFHILKSRGIDHLESDKMEGKLLPEVVDLGHAGKRKQIPIGDDTSEDGNAGVYLEPISQRQVTNHGREQLVLKDFHLCVKQDCTIQSPRNSRLGNQLSAGWYDSCSSDWEHVAKEELSGQNS